MTNAEATKEIKKHCYFANLKDEAKEALDLAIKALKQTEWIPVTERLPESEEEVVICAIRKRLSGKEIPIITTAMYEDGTVRDCDSLWNWQDIEWAGWDDEEDCGIIPEGWWEHRHYNLDDVYNNPIDDFVVAWMPFPEPYKGEEA